MRRYLVVAAVVVIAGGIAAGQHVTSAGAESGRRFVHTEKLTSVTKLDLGSPGGGQSDRWVYASDVFDERGEKIGIGGGECLVVTPKGQDQALFNCTGTDQFDDGQIIFSGLYDSTVRTNQIAISGRTGRYQGAKGTLEFVTGADPDTYEGTFHLAD